MSLEDTKAVGLLSLPDLALRRVMYELDSVALAVAAASHPAFSDTEEVAKCKLLERDRSARSKSLSRKSGESWKTLWSWVQRTDQMDHRRLSAGDAHFLILSNGRAEVVSH